MLVARTATTFTGAAVRGLGAAASSTIAVTLPWRSAAPWFDHFALAHVAYLAITVTVPVIAAAGLFLRWRADQPFLASRGVAVSLFLALLPAVIGVYATHIEPGRLEVDHHELRLGTSGAAATTPIRVAVLADVQTPRIRAHELDALQQLGDADPDLLLVPGDLWSSGVAPDEWPAFRSYVESMLDVAPHVVIVEGDSDDVDRLRRLAEGTGVHVLADEILDIDVGGHAVRVAGLTLRERTAEGAQRRAIEQLEAAGTDTVRILLSHRPDAVYDLTEPIDLVVAGHTHGGQIALPFVGPLLTLSAVPRSVAAGGLHTIDTQPIYVSTGVGMERSHAPQVRFGVRPSVGVIDLVPAPGS